MPSWVHLSLSPTEARAIEAALRGRLGLAADVLPLPDDELAATLTALDKAGAACSGQTRMMSAQPKRLGAALASASPARWRITEGPFAGCVGVLHADEQLRRYERALEIQEPPILGQMLVTVKEGFLAPVETVAAGEEPLQQLG